jgi:hypothetical protein
MWLIYMCEIYGIIIPKVNAISTRGQNMAIGLLAATPMITLHLSVFGTNLVN